VLSQRVGCGDGDDDGSKVDFNVEATLDSDDCEVALGSSGVGWCQARGGTGVEARSFGMEATHHVEADFGLEAALDSDNAEVALGSSDLGWRQARGGAIVEVVLGSSDMGRCTTRTCGGATVGSDLGGFFIIENLFLISVNINRQYHKDDFLCGSMTADIKKA
jgi:hypothetical protein